MRYNGLDMLLVLLKEVNQDIFDTSLAKLICLKLAISFSNLLVLAEEALAGHRAWFWLRLGVDEHRLVNVKCDL